MFNNITLQCTTTLLYYYTTVLSCVPAYLEGDDDGLEVVASPLDVGAHFLDIDVVQCGVDLVHHEEWSRAEAGSKKM